MILEAVKQLCQERGISINKLETELGFSQGSIGKMSDSSPKSDRLDKIAQYFGVPMEYFLTDESEMAKRFEYYAERFYPLYRAAAGEGAYNDTYADDYIKEEDGYEYAEVIGDSMLPVLQSGDIVKIQPQAETLPTDYTLVKVDGDHATIKFVEIVENGVWLRALNKEVYADRFFTIQEVMTLPVTIIGKVVELRRAL